MTHIQSLRGSKTSIQGMPLDVLSIVRMADESKASYMACSCTGLASAIICLWAVTSLHVQDNDVQRAADLNRDHLDYLVEESWRWAFACRLSHAPPHY